MVARDERFERLVGCFKQVFPAMNPVDIPTATQASTPAWDSIAHVTLFSLAGEEFGTDLDFEEFADAGSFAAILDLVCARA